jgi:hypothetical protein
MNSFYNAGHLNVASIRQKRAHIPLSIAGPTKARAREPSRETLDADRMKHAGAIREPTELLGRARHRRWE